MNLLLVGGTGKVGQVVREHLQGRGHSIRILTTSAQKASEFPEDIEGIVGDLNDKDSAAPAFTDIDVVFLLTAHTQQEVQQGQNAVELAKAAGVKKIVFQSIHLAANAPEVEHFLSKVLIEEAIEKSGLDYVFISPNNFYQNELLFKDAIVNHVYNQPIGSVGLSRVDVRDIAQAVVKVIETDEFNGQNIALAGPDVLTGEQTAQILAEELGYDVQYSGDDLESFKKTMYQFLPTWMVDDWATMYDFFQREGLIATTEQLAVLENVLGRKPITYREFLKDNVDYFK